MNKKTGFALVLFAQISLPAILPLAFEANLGQTDSRVRYFARASQSALWLTDQEAVLGSAQGALRIRFQGGNRDPIIQAEEALPGKANYFIGSQSSHWRQDIPLFGKVRYRSIYPGIDAVFYGNPQDLEYDLVLAPGADPHRIRLTFAGAKRMRIDSSGDLIFTVGSSEIRQHRPKIFQGTQTIDGRYVALGRNRIGFSIAAYDRTRSLTIDPVVTYSTYLGGTGFDQAQAIAMDAQGNLYVTGTAGSPDFPIVGGINAPPPPNRTAVPFIAKINPSASGAASLLWSTYLGGGSNGTLSLAIAVDPSGNVYAAGATLSSNDFATTKNAFQTSSNCNAIILGATSNCLSGWVAKVSPDGNRLIYSSYLAGGLIDSVSGIAVDAAGNAYLLGSTSSPDFPVRGSPAYQSRLQGRLNGFVSKVSPDGSTLLYSTFFGGDGTDFLESIVLDSNGIVYVSGYTTSAHFPVTTNAYQMSLQGAQTAGFVAKLDMTQGGPSALLYGTYIGGPSAPAVSIVRSIAVDSTGSIYAAGTTTDPNFPVTAGAFQTKFGGVILNDPADVTGDAFVLKLNPAAQGSAQLMYSSFFGGAGNETALALAVDASGRMLIAGATGSSNLPTTPDAYQCCLSNPGNLKNNVSGFLARIDPTKNGPSGLLYATYLGGSTGTSAYLNGAAMNTAGTVAAVAGIAPNNFPVTSSAFEKKSRNPSLTTYVAAFNLPSSGPIISTAVNAANFQPTGLSPGLIFTLTGSALGPDVPFGPQLDATGRVATLVSGTQVLVDGVPAPLLYGSATQINAVAPYELASKIGTTVFAQVISNGIAGNVMPVTVIATAPGIFYSAGGQGAILNQDAGINGANNPAAKGSFISIYCTGEGQTNPPGIDGHVANEGVAQLAHPVASVTVSIGGITVAPTDVYYAGASPQSVAGVLQVTVKIPANAASGNIPVIVTVGSQNSQSGVTVAVQ